jgi:type II secretory pathway component PulF
MEISYRYKARDKFGRSLTGQMTAASDAEVATSLKAKGLTPFSVEQVEEKTGGDFMARFRRFKQSDVNAFTRELYTLTKAGLTILGSLEVIGEQDRNPILKKIVEGLIQSIRGGASISDSLQRYPKIFSPLYVNMIRAGEVSGRLEQILERLIFLGESDEKLQMRVKAALRYPAIVLGALVLAFLFLTNFIIPRFAKLFTQAGVELPLPTRILLWVHDAVTKYGWITAIVLTVLGVLLVRFLKTPTGQLWRDRLVLKLPVFGSLIIKSEMSRFSRIMALLIQSGIPALRALEIASGSSDNKVVVAAIDKIRVSVTEGTSMSEPMKTSGIFPPSVIRMVRVGEETGKIDELLLKVSEYYDIQVDYTVTNLMVLIEPMLIVVLGGMVFVLALGMFLPMWNMIKVFKQG